jgi:hypothetical protein
MKGTMGRGMMWMKKVTRRMKRSRSRNKKLMRRHCGTATAYIMTLTVRTNNTII